MTADAGRDSSSRPTPHGLDLVEYVVLALPELSRIVPVAEALARLVTSSQIRILDIVGVRSDATGRVEAVEPELLPGLAPLLRTQKVVGGLLSNDDIALACRRLPPGASALIVVAENRWPEQLADAARAIGGEIVGGDRIARHRLEQLRRSRVRFGLEDEEV